MTSGLRAGTFDSLSIVTPDQLKLSAELQYTSNAVFLHITEASLFGDFNGDLLVDCHDIDGRWLRNLRLEERQPNLI